MLEARRLEGSCVFESVQMPSPIEPIDAYLDIAEVMILVLDREGRIQRINRKGAEVLGYKDGAELEGRSWFQTAIPEPDRARMQSVFKGVLGGEGAWPQQYENEVVTASGEVRIIEWRNTMLRDSDGQVTGTLSSGTDVTERRSIEDQLRETEHRQRYLLLLEARLRDATSAREAVNAACEALGHELGATFVGVGDLQTDDEHTVVQSEWRKVKTIPSTIGRHHQPSTGPDRFAEMLEGKVVAVGDVLTDSRTASPEARQAYAAFGGSLFARHSADEGRQAPRLDVHR